MPNSTEAVLEQAREAYEAYDFPRAMQLALTAAQAPEGQASKLTCAQALQLAARSALLGGETLPAALHFEGAAELFAELGEHHELLDCQLGLAKCAARRGEVALALHLAQAALKEAQQRKYKDLEAEALAVLGNSAWKQGDAATAVLRLGQAVELFTKLRLYNKAHSARGSLAVALVMTGAAEESAAVSKRALDYFRNQGDMRAVAKILSNLGYVAFTLGEYDTARSYLRRLLQMEEALQDRSIMLTTALNLGLLELREGRFKMARKPLTRAYHLAGEAGDRVSEGSALNYLALLALHEGLPEEAQNYMELADNRLAGSGADEALIMRYYLPVVLLANNQVKRAAQLWRQKPELQALATYVDDLLNLYRVLEYMVRSTVRQGIVLEPEARLWARRWRDEIDTLLKNITPLS